MPRTKGSGKSVAVLMKNRSKRKLAKGPKKKHARAGSLVWQTNRVKTVRDETGYLTTDPVHSVRSANIWDAEKVHTDLVRISNLISTSSENQCEEPEPQPESAPTWAQAPAWAQAPT